jgi:hypothetical protein
MIGTLLGAGMGIAQTVMNQQNRNKMKRIQEAKVQQMESENDANRENLQSISPEAAYQSKLSSLNEAQSSAESAALNTQANSAVSGSGDVGGAGIGAVKSAMAAHGATAPIAQAKAGAAGEMVSDQLNKGQAIDQNIMQGAQIGDMVNYNEQDKQMDIMNAISGGANVMSNLGGLTKSLASGEEKDTSEKTVKPNRKSLWQDPGALKRLGGINLFGRS